MSLNDVGALKSFLLKYFFLKFGFLKDIRFFEAYIHITVFTQQLLSEQDVEKVDSRRVNILKAQNIQLERQVCEM